MAMRYREDIMPMNSNSLPACNLTGGDPEDVNSRIILELLLDIRQFQAANFVCLNKLAEDPLPCPAWVIELAKGQ